MIGEVTFIKFYARKTFKVDNFWAVAKIVKGALLLISFENSALYGDSCICLAENGRAHE